MFNDSIKFKGELTISVYDQFGQLKDERHVKNLVVASGKAYFAARATTNAVAIASHMAVGTGSLPPVSTDTTLQSELARVALVSTSVTDNVITYIATFPNGVGTGALTEAGIFNDAVAGSMVARTTFAVVTKGANDSITIQWSITAQ